MLEVVAILFIVVDRKAVEVFPIGGPTAAVRLDTIADLGCYADLVVSGGLETWVEASYLVT